MLLARGVLNDIIDSYKPNYKNFIDIVWCMLIEVTSSDRLLFTPKEVQDKSCLDLGSGFTRIRHEYIHAVRNITLVDPVYMVFGDQPIDDWKYSTLLEKAESFGLHVVAHGTHPYHLTERNFNEFKAIVSSYRDKITLLALSITELSANLLESFDVINARGVLNYLDSEVMKSSVKPLFQSLKQGGELRFYPTVLEEFIFDFPILVNIDKDSIASKDQLPLLQEILKEKPKDMELHFARIMPGIYLGSIRSGINEFLSSSCPVYSTENIDSSGVIELKV